jgi:hypothetical protein
VLAEAKPLLTHPSIMAQPRFRAPRTGLSTERAGSR